METINITLSVIIGLVAFSSFLSISLILIGFNVRKKENGIMDFQYESFKSVYEEVSISIEDIRFYFEELSNSIKNKSERKEYIEEVEKDVINPFLERLSRIKDDYEKINRTDIFLTKSILNALYELREDVVYLVEELDEEVK